MDSTKYYSCTKRIPTAIEFGRYQMNSETSAYCVWFKNSIIRINDIKHLYESRFNNCFMYYHSVHSKEDRFCKMVKGTYEYVWLSEDISEIPKEFLLQLNLEELR